MKTTSALYRRAPGKRAQAMLALTVCLLMIGPGLGLVSADRDNTLRLAGPVQGPETLDPAQARDLSSVPILRQIFRGLMYYDDALNPIPELASSYEVSADGLLYTFRIRAGATFQDGSPITAGDVAFSLTRAVNPDTVNGDLTRLSGPAFLSDIAGFDDVVSGESDTLSGIQVLSDDLISITLVAPRATFLMKLASVPATIVNRHQVESDSTWWLDPIGSGPYAVAKWKESDELVLARFEHFALGKPRIESIRFRLGARAVQSFNLYQADEIDIDSVTLYDLDRVIDPNGAFADQLVRTPQFGFGYIALRSDIAPLDDPKIREALQLAFPRNDLAAVGFNGLVEASYGILPKGLMDRDWEPVLAPANFDAAREAITESTYRNATNVPPIRIYTSGALASEILRSVADTELGLTIDVFDLEWYDFLDRLESDQLPAFELYWAADYPDPEAILLALWGSDQPNNYTGFSNDAVDQVLAMAASAGDVNQRARLFEEAQRLILAENVVIPAYMDVQYTVIKPYLSQVLVTPLGILRFETVTID